jgi:sulfhydrogenase subunit alpha
MDNRRFYEEAVKGKSYNAVPQLVSRICGTCSIAHLTACIEAVEKTLDIKISPQTLLLRKLTMYSLMIRDHALHLYFFVLPDLFKLDSLLDLAEEKKELIHKALHVKEAGNNLSKLIAGRAVHAPYEQVGGFSNEIDKSKIAPAIEELKSVRGAVIELIDLLAQCDWNLQWKQNMVGLVTDDFSFLEGKIRSTAGAVIEEADYWDHLQNVVIPYSQADSFKFEGGNYIVGALARVNMNKDKLHEKTRKDLVKYLEMFPSQNVYHNNVAQAIEILHSIDHSVEILENNTFEKEEPVQATKKNGEGVGVIEAPRGTLYYWLGINEGKVRYANLVIPTAQNLIAMREIINDMLPPLIEQGEEVIRKESEKLIRAFDPCMSCASHFLKINWI